MNQREARLGLALAFTLAACSSSKKLTSVSTTSEINTFCNGLIQAIATNASQCQGGSVADWESIFTSGPEASYCADLVAAISAGRVIYNANSAPQCLSAMQSESCESRGAMPTACQSALQGTVVAGAPCYGSTDCVSGTLCAITTVTSCTGTCVATIPTGGSCQLNGIDLCVSGEECVGPTAGGVAGTCGAVPPPNVVGQGAPCGEVDDGGSAVCGPALFCSDSTSPSTCTPILNPGAACTAGSCEPFAYCAIATSLCTALPSTVGAACGEQEDASMADYVACAQGYYCSIASGGASGTCAAQLPIGASCVHDAPCASLTCSTNSGEDAGTCIAACSQL